MDEGISGREAGAPWRNASQLHSWRLREYQGKFYRKAEDAATPQQMPSGRRVKSIAIPRRRWRASAEHHDDAA